MKFEILLKSLNIENNSTQTITTLYIHLYKNIYFEKKCRILLNLMIVLILFCEIVLPPPQIFFRSRGVQVFPISSENRWYCLFLSLGLDIIFHANSYLLQAVFILFLIISGERKIGRLYYRCQDVFCLHISTQILFGDFL